MIYINKNITSPIMLKMLNYSLNMGCNRIAFWPYNNRYEAFKKHLDISSSSEKKKIERVTIYSEADNGMVNYECFVLNNDIINALNKNYFKLTESLDSISLYKKKYKKWFLCIIFHENMSLARFSADELMYFEKLRIPFSNEPPENW